MRSKLLTTCLAALLFALPVLAENPRIPNDINFELPASDTQWHIITKQNNTPVLRFYTYQGTSAWSSLGWTGKFKYSKTDSSTGMAEIAGTSFTNYIDFQAVTNSFSAPVSKWYCTVLLSTGVLNVSQASGLLTIERAPELNSSPIINAAPLIDWSRYRFTNAPIYGPYLGGSNTSLRIVGTNGQYYIDITTTNLIDLLTFGILTNSVTNVITKLNVISNRVVITEAQIVSNINNIANASNFVYGSENVTNGANMTRRITLGGTNYLITGEGGETNTAYIASNHTFNIVMPKLDATSNTLVTATGTLATALQPASTSNWQVGSHAGFLASGSNNNVLVNGAGYVASNSTPMLYGDNFTNIPSGAITGAVDVTTLGFFTNNFTGTGVNLFVTGNLNVNGTNIMSEVEIHTQKTTTAHGGIATSAQGAKADTALQNFAPFTVVTNIAVTTNIASVTTNLTVAGLTTYNGNATNYIWGAYTADRYGYSSPDPFIFSIYISGGNWILYQEGGGGLSETGPANTDPPIGEYTGNDTAATVSYTSITTNYTYVTNTSYTIFASGSNPVTIITLTNVPANAVTGLLSILNMPSQVLTNNQPTVAFGTATVSQANITNVTVNGNITSSGTNTAAEFIGNGSGVTNANAGTFSGSGKVMMTNETYSFTPANNNAAIQAIIDARAWNLGGNTLTFSYGAGTYTNTSLVWSNYYNGTLTITGVVVSNSVAHTNQSTVFDLNTSAGFCARLLKCSAISTFKNIKMLITTDTNRIGVDISSCTFVYVQDCFFRGTGVASLSTAINLNDSGMNTFQNNAFDNIQRAHQSLTAHSYISGSKTLGTNPTYGLVCYYGGIAQRGDTNACGVTANYVANGGLIITSAGLITP